MDFREAGCENVTPIYVAQDRVHRRALVNTVTNIRVP